MIDEPVLLGTAALVAVPVVTITLVTVPLVTAHLDAVPLVAVPLVTASTIHRPTPHLVTMPPVTMPIQRHIPPREREMARHTRRLGRQHPVVTMPLSAMPLVAMPLTAMQPGVICDGAGVLFRSQRRLVVHHRVVFDRPAAHGRRQTALGYRALGFLTRGHRQT